MSDWIPSTDEVRESFVSGELGDDAINKERCAPVYAEFDRWLNRIKAEAWDECNFDICDGVKNELNPYRD